MTLKASCRLAPGMSNWCWGLSANWVLMVTPWSYFFSMILYGASLSGMVMVHSPGEGVISGLTSLSFACWILWTIWSNSFFKVLHDSPAISLPCRACEPLVKSTNDRKPSQRKRILASVVWGHEFIVGCVGEKASVHLVSIGSESWGIVRRWACER